VRESGERLSMEPDEGLNGGVNEGLNGGLDPTTLRSQHQWKPRVGHLTDEPPRCPNPTHS